MNLKQLADTNHDHILSAREIRTALNSIIRGVIAGKSEADINGDGAVNRADISDAVRVFRSLLSAVCGNGKVEAGEQCDDGNTVAGDGCDSACQIEPAYTCSGSPSVCTLKPVCGNGKVEAGEQCDLGTQNGVAGSGCSSTCQQEMDISIHDTQFSQIYADPQSGRLTYVISVSVKNAGPGTVQQVSLKMPYVDGFTGLQNGDTTSCGVQGGYAGHARYIECGWGNMAPGIKILNFWYTGGNPYTACDAGIHVELSGIIPDDLDPSNNTADVHPCASPQSLPAPSSSSAASSVSSSAPALPPAFGDAKPMTALPPLFLLFINDKGNMAQGTWSAAIPTTDENRFSIPAWGQRAGVFYGGGGEQITWDDGTAWVLYTKYPLPVTLTYYTAASHAPITVIRNGINIAFIAGQLFSLGHVINATQATADLYPGDKVTFTDTTAAWDDGTLWTKADAPQIAVTNSTALPGAPPRSFKYRVIDYVSQPGATADTPATHLVVPDKTFPLPRPVSNIIEPPPTLTPPPPVVCNAKTLTTPKVTGPVFDNTDNPGCGPWATSVKNVQPPVVIVGGCNAGCVTTSVSDGTLVIDVPGPSGRCTDANMCVWTTHCELTLGCGPK